MLICSAVEDNRWAVQARLRLTKAQKMQLAEQGKENAAVLGMQRERCVSIASELQVRRWLRNAYLLHALTTYRRRLPWL